MSEEKKLEWAATFKAIAGEKYEQFKTAFAELKAKYNAAPPPAPVPTPVALDKTMKTQDGLMTISIAGDPATATVTTTIPVMDITSGTPVALADGSYVLEDGSTITVVGGAITTYTAATPAPAPPLPGMDMAQFKAAFAAEFKADFAKEFETKFAAQQLKITELETALTDHNVQLKHLVEFADMALTTPVDGKPSKPEKPWSEMTGLEQAEYKASLRK